MSEITFTIFAAEDPWYLMTEGDEPHTAILPGLWSEVEGNGAECAADVAVDYFKYGLWHEWFSDDDGATVMVEIFTEPNKGIYEVTLERTVVASAVQTKDPRP